MPSCMPPNAAIVVIRALPQKRQALDFALFLPGGDETQQAPHPAVGVTVPVEKEKVVREQQKMLLSTNDYFEPVKSEKHYVLRYQGGKWRH